MKRFTLYLSWRENEELRQVDKIEADDLVQVLSQLNFVILNIQRKQLKEQMELRGVDDDIPF